MVYLQFRQLQLLESLLAWLMVVLLVGCREVRDYVEAGAKSGSDAVIRTRAYGELWVPEANDLLQQTKVGGKENDELAITEIASFVTEN